MFRKVLIANRGEIAVRIARTLREMGIATQAVYSEADRDSLHVRMADEALCIGPAASADSYLRIDRIVDAARARGAEAIHPGYGFLSENPDFAAACEAAGIVFIGPSAASIRRMGSKTAAREVALQAGVPIVPGTIGPTDLEQVAEFAHDAGFPVMLKAIAGGGGKGMRRVNAAAGLESAFRDASSEAETAFGNGALYVEKLIENPRHIEIQVIGDRHGRMIHLAERECSLQRRHQKILEECPSPLLARHPEMRERMGAAAVRVARAAGYYNAGTVEFLVDAGRGFHFLEMNTRLQVEHPVTELVTGLDLVRLQLEIAAGLPVPLEQSDVALRGAAIECRIYAEDPEREFLPSPGRITRIAQPAGPGIRLDAGIYPGWSVPIHYDPLLAKLACWRETRDGAIARMIRALGEYHVAGVRTNILFFRELLADPEFREGMIDTGFLQRYFERRALPAEPDALSETAAVLAARAFLARPAPAGEARRPNRWRDAGLEELLR